jgi:hypothetical protein
MNDHRSLPNHRSTNSSIDGGGLTFRGRDRGLVEGGGWIVSGRRMRWLVGAVDAGRFDFDLDRGAIGMISGFGENRTFGRAGIGMISGCSANLTDAFHRDCVEMQGWRNG